MFNSNYIELYSMQLKKTVRQNYQLVGHDVSCSHGLVGNGQKQKNNVGIPQKYFLALYNANCYARKQMKE